MTNIEFNPENFQEKGYEKGAVLFYFEKNKDKEFSECFNHSTNKKSKSFTGFTDIKKFLSALENKNIKIYITIGNTAIVPFIKVEGGFLIDIKSYIDFQETIKGSNGGKMKAFLTQTFNIHNTELTQEQMNFLVAENATEENISDIINKLTPEKQQSILSFLKIKLGESGDFDLKSDPEGIFLEIGNINNKDIVIEQLKTLEKNNFANIENALSISKIDKVLVIWEQNKSNSHEVSFWQDFLKTNPWILSQVFPAPFAIFENEFYVGGHYSGNLSGSKNTDFGYKNPYSQNTAIIEIKTPTTPLVSKDLYGTRKGIYPMSQELIGSISQVLNQKDLLQKDYLQNNVAKDFKVWNPKIILIIGSEEYKPLNNEQRACFELFKHSNKDIDVITFDELFEKIKNLKALYE